MSDKKCTAGDIRSRVFCGQKSVKRVKVVCVHEHVLYGDLCDLHLRWVEEGRVKCRVCREAGSEVFVVPVDQVGRRAVAS